MSKNAKHLKWCRWCDFVKSESTRRRHEEQAHNFEREETKKMGDFQRSKTSRAASGYIWCTACNVIVENTISGVSNHSNSKYHQSKSGRPLRVVSNSIVAASKTAVAAAPQLHIPRRRPEVQEQPEDAEDGFENGAHEQSGACLLLLFLFFSFLIHAFFSNASDPEIGSESTSSTPDSDDEKAETAFLFDRTSPEERNMPFDQSSHGTRDMTRDTLPPFRWAHPSQCRECA